MMPDPFPPEELGPAEPGWLSIGGESIPFTMQAEVGHMTIDEAIASGFFDLPDEPGMVRIPITMNVMIPLHLLYPPEPESEPPVVHELPQYRNGVPPRMPGSPPGGRFGNYPRGIAARNVMASLKEQMWPDAVAPVPGLPAAVAAATGHRAGTSAASATAGSSGLLDAGVDNSVPGKLQGSRFGNYPRGIAAQNVMASVSSQMWPDAVAPVPGLPAAVAAAIGQIEGTYTASVAAVSAGLLDAGAEAERFGLALLEGRGAAVAGPLGVMTKILWPTATGMDDRPIAIRELAEKQDASTRLEANHNGQSAFTATPPLGPLQGRPVPAPLPPLPGLTPPKPLPPLPGFTPSSTPIHTTLPGAPLDRPSLANAQVNIAPDVSAGSNILERNELGRRMEEAGTIAPHEAAHHIVPGGGPKSGRRNPKPAQDALAGVRVDLNEPANGVGLSPDFHNQIHTSSYYSDVNRRLLGVGSREEAVSILEELRQDLKQADSVYQQTGKLPDWIRKTK